jgi:uncharacterized protein
VTLRSALYDGEVVHERFRPRSHRLRYRVFSMLFDLDELPRLGRHGGLFGYNRRAPISFFDRDHGPRDGRPLRPWAEAMMRGAGVEPDGGPIALLCYPRIFGYVFNPLSVYFCRRRDGALAAILYQVHNTHGEQHTYAIAVTGGDKVIQQRAEKAFFVSPFIGPAATYNFRIIPPGEATSVVIRQEADGELLMAASFRGERAPFTTRNLARHLAAFPFMTLKVIAAIHWEAVKLWLKGFEVFPHAPRPEAHGKAEPGA